ncbi:MAG: c-type cytochrome, partial [Candidatus Hydrogenedentes bacterium]|nr:c-type cytochrome [Candidatus Hydrogenedentota bacterium]
PVWHYALDDRAMRRNPHFAPGNPREYVVPQAQLFPTSRTLTRFNDFEHVNRSTSTCGIEIYRDTVLGPEFSGNAFVCEPVHDLVLRTVLGPSGVTFSGHRAPGEESAEFLSSHDNWFRPVQIRTGPDGALYVVDMYREVIEHPEYISAETQATLHLRAGDDKGRIYRVVPVHGALRTVPRLDTMSAAELTAQLESPNGTLRDMAHQRIVERNDNTVAAPLRELLRTSASPQARVHALCALDGLGALTPDDVSTGLRDAAPGVRRHAVRLAAAHTSDWPELGGALLALKDDPDPLVHIELIYALGDSKHPGAAAALGEFVTRNAGDAYLGMALLSSLNDTNLRALTGALLDWAASPAAAPEPRDQAMSVAVGVAIATNDAETLAHMAATIAKHDSAMHTPEPFLWLAAFLDALDRKGATLDALGSGDAPDAARAAIARMLDAARATAGDAADDDTLRANAARALGKNAQQAAADVALLAQLLTAGNPDAVRGAALETLVKIGDSAVPSALLGAWADLDNDSRGIALDAMIERDAWTGALMGALESGTPGFRELDATRRQRLLTSGNTDIRARAEKLMSNAANPDRQAVIDQYGDAATIPGQFLRGRGIFRERCASCHQLGAIGHPVGPDLTAITDRSPLAVLTSILDPNRAVETKFFDYTIETDDLMTYSGIVVEESGNSVTIRGANGAENKVLRSNIESMTTQSRSTMPDGLEDGLTPEDLANLLAFILDARPKE